MLTELLDGKRGEGMAHMVKGLKYMEQLWDNE